MSIELNSDEDKYANESFENDTDEIPEISETESESEDEAAVVTTQNNLYTYAQNGFSGRKNSFQKNNYLPFDSSSEDDQDVVVSETIAEINTEPMCMDDAMETHRTPVDSRRGSSARMKGGMRMPVESLAILEIPNFPSYASDDCVVDEISDNGDAKSRLTADENEGELLEKFNHLSCAQNEVSNAGVIEGDDVLVVNKLLQADMSIEPLKEPLKAQTIELNIPSIEKCHTNSENISDTENDDEYAPKETDKEFVEYEPSIEVHITSETPTSFNSDDYAFHLNFLKANGSNEKLKMRAYQRKSWSFSNDRMREIERHNHILLRKILSQKPTYQSIAPKPKKFATLPTTSRITSAAINRKKKQRQIDLDNQGLKRRIEAISLRRPAVQNLS
ncbi:protein hemingway [Anastrepha ludens]|uniref:protein hemingway n=1 Tax=Anastrepha ludens TaxID=28586 RepID=UPI0023AFBDE7|nr:protein hemingway [Anastrepha ludens]